MIIKVKKNLTINGIQYLQGQEYNVSQKEYSFISLHADIIKSEEPAHEKPAEEKPVEVKNKVLKKKEVNKK